MYDKLFTMYNELFMHVKQWLTNHLHGKAAEHS